jgi:hypothetical protein
VATGCVCRCNKGCGKVEWRKPIDDRKDEHAWDRIGRRKLLSPETTPAWPQAMLSHHQAVPAPISPWRADKIPGGCLVRDANGQALAFVYSRDSDAEARQAKVFTKDEALRIAINIARLPEQLGKADRG